MIGSAEADVRDLLVVTTVLDDEVCAANNGQRTSLGDIGSVIERACGDGFVDEERLFFELERSDEHEVKRRAMRGRGQWEIVGYQGGF
jgi:hypothetical protein